MPEIMESFDANSVYNADETGLFYRATPDSSLCFSTEKLSGSKKAMDRITVLVCANMSGSDKRKLLVIGKSKNPRCFKQIDVNKLPVTYRSNQRAWMTIVLFEEWLREWDKELRLENRTILLLLDNCSAHPHVPLDNIKLEFLPPNTTSVIQPMDQGVIKNLKTHYRKELINMTLSHIETGLLAPGSSAVDVSSKVTVLDAIQFVAKSWRQVKGDCIANCFKKGGFACSQPDVTLQEEGGEEEKEEEDEVEAYIDMHNTAECRGEEASDDDIVEAVRAAKRRRTEATAETTEEEEGEEEEEDEDEEETAPVTGTEAKRAIEVLCRYATVSGFDESTLKKLDDVGAAVARAAVERMKQPTINTFFKTV